MDRRTFIGGALATAALGSGCASLPVMGSEKRWYRGNLHTHTLVSDGMAFPVESALLYKKIGYDFLMFSDHNAVHDREFWFTKKSHPRHSFYDSEVRRFVEKFPAYRPQTRREPNGATAWRYGPFEETAAAVNEPGRFLLMSGCEYNDTISTGHQLHCLGINVRKAHAGSTFPTQEASLANMYADFRRKNPGDTSIFVVNHPLWWLYDVDPRLLSEHDEITHFEVGNKDGVPAVRLPEGYDEDRMWDYALARRLRRGGPLLYGIATDDTHGYMSFYRQLYEGKKRYAGWVAVRAARLETADIVAALRKGDFYASTGVELEDVEFDGRTLSVRIRPEEGARYAIRFVGTKRNADLSTFSPGEPQEGGVLLRRGGAKKTEMPGWLGSRRSIARFPKEAGIVLAESTEHAAAYRLKDDDLYVRAKIFKLGTKEVAWTQPCVS